MRRDSRRGAHSLIEMTVVLAIVAILLMGILTFFRTGQKQIVTVSDHAQARMNAIQVSDQVADDLVRCVVADAVTDLVFPVHIEDNGRTLWFRALHHRKYDAGTREMKLIARKITYASRPVGGNQPGRVVLRNGEPLKALGGIGNLDPVSDLTFKEMDKARACELGISPFHAIEVRVQPRGQWDVHNTSLAQLEANIQKRIVHLADLEAQFACMVSIKRSNPPPAFLAVYPDIDQLDLPWGGSCPLIEGAPNMPMDWLRPPGLIQYDDSTPFDHATADQDE